MSRNVYHDLRWLENRQRHAWNKLSKNFNKKLGLVMFYVYYGSLSGDILELRKADCSKKKFCSETLNKWIFVEF